MNKLELSSAFLIRHDVIDAEHAELVNILNDIIEGYKSKDILRCKESWQIFGQALRRHFTSEEQIMADLGFDKKEHRIHHQKIIEHIKVKCGKNKTLKDWKNCLVEVEHDILTTILRYDLKFSEYLIGIGYSKY